MPTTETFTLAEIHPERLYSTNQAAQALELHPDTVYKIPRALLPRTIVGPRGGRTKIRGRDLLAYAADRSATPSPPAALNIERLAEEVEATRAEKLAPPPLRALPNLVEVTGWESGVYFLVSAGEVVYVGQSENLSGRITQHRDKEFDRVFMIPLPTKGAMLKLEAALIRRLRPRYNKLVPVGATHDEEVLRQYFPTLLD